MGATGPVSCFIEVRGLRFHYLDWEAPGPPVLCVHGLTSNCHAWDSIAEDLCPQYRVLAIDLRGRGESDKPPTGYGPQEHVADLIALLDAWKIPQVLYIGHSMGAMIGVYLAAYHPQRISRLVLIDGGDNLPSYIMDALKLTLGRLGVTYPSFQAYLDILKAAPFFKGCWNDYIERHYDFDVEHLPDGSVRSKISREMVEQEMASLLDPRSDLRALHPRISCPTLIVRAAGGILKDDDWVLPPQSVEAMKKNIPQVEAIELEGTNHMTIVLSKQPRLVGAIKAFFSS